MYLRGAGVCIEDDTVVTMAGIKVLSAALLTSSDDIKAWMEQKQVQALMVGLTDAFDRNDAVGYEFHALGRGFRIEDVTTTTEICMAPRFSVVRSNLAAGTRSFSHMRCCAGAFGIGACSSGTELDEGMASLRVRVVS